MTPPLERTVVQPTNPILNVSANYALPHSPGIRVGDWVFLSGMGPIDGRTGERVHGPIADQVRATLANMAHMLDCAGSSLARAVKVHVILARAEDFDEMNRVYAEFFPIDPPARTSCVLQLSHGNGCEIECIALASERKPAS